jgi:hypothetical protein
LFFFRGKIRVQHLFEVAGLVGAVEFARDDEGVEGVG